MLTGFNLTKLSPNQTSSAIYECTLIDSQKPAETLLISNLTSASHTNLVVIPPHQDLLPSGDDYDYNGALVYLIFLLMWYAASVIALICSSTKRVACTTSTTTTTRMCTLLTTSWSRRMAKIFDTRLWVELWLRLFSLFIVLFN
jgi:hypothetical protein